LWRSWGIEPAAVLGHSVGEYVAACVAGVFSLEEGLRLIAERARLMQALPQRGMMVSVRAEEALVAEAIASYADSVSIAAVNGPQSVVISGAASAIEEIVASLCARAVDCKRLTVSHAFHSPLLDPMLATFEAAAAGVPLQRPRLRLISNLTGAVADAELTHPGYWRRTAREPVQFARSMRTLAALGCDAFIEIGPHPVLLGMGQSCIAPEKALWLPSLRRERDDWCELLGGLAQLHVAGAEVRWEEFHRGRGRRKVWLPTYPFQGARYWIDPRPAASAAAPPTRGNGAHPLLGVPLRTAGTQRIFEARLGADQPAYLADHRVHGAVVLPAAAYIEMVAAAAEAVLGARAAEIEDLVLHEPLVLPEGELRTVQTVVTAEGDGAAGVEIFSLEESGAEVQAEGWRLHASATALRRPAGTPPPEVVSLTGLAAQLPEERSAAEHYEEMAARGLDFGERFHGVLRLRRGEGEALGEARLPESLAAQEKEYRIHPVLLDACLQAVGGALPASDGATYLPLSFGRIRLHAGLTGTVRSCALVRPPETGQQTLTAELQVYDDTGRTLLEVEAISLRPAARAALRATGEAFEEWLYDLVWEPQPRISVQSAGRLPLDQLIEPAAAHAAALPTGADAELLEELWPKLDELSAAYAAQALAELGWRPRPGECVSVEELGPRLGIVERYARLLARLLEIFAEDGVLEPSADGWHVARELAYPDAESLAHNLQTRYPPAANEIGILQRCGAALGETLRGERDPLDLLFPGGSLAEAEQMYRGSPLTREFNALVARSVGAVLKGLPA
ncbi:MAG TPA: acyltransferase domain-containing protein, partial [Longimicrobiaceae bacterium]|nr:acyltransferase domain-containing protein [Longimicrobiaceae bacterium]